MSSRPGGETDRPGNKFELVWAIRHVFYCVFDDRRVLAAEDVDVEVGQGSEFTYDIGLVIEAHRVKRQNSNSNG